MEHTTSAKEEPYEGPATLLSQLRWILAGLKMSGIKDWPVRSQPVPPEQPAASPVVVPQVVVQPVDPPGPEPSFAEDIDPIAFSGFDEPPSALEPSPSSAAPTREAAGNPEQVLLTIREEMGDCRRCRLHSGRKHLVFSDGSPHARLVFVGEGPGFDEDRQGLPFVGKAGKLLDKMIRSIGFLREEVYICNVVKCRPPNNRTPEPDEIAACSPFMIEQIHALHPQAICALGACAAQTLLGASNTISRLRGKIHRWRGIPLVCTYHPAYLLRTPAQKAATWQDLLMISRILQEGESTCTRGLP